MQTYLLERESSVPDKHTTIAPEAPSPTVLAFAQQVSPFFHNREKFFRVEPVLQVMQEVAASAMNLEDSRQKQADFYAALEMVLPAFILRPFWERHSSIFSCFRKYGGELNDARDAHPVSTLVPEEKLLEEYSDTDWPILRVLGGDDFLPKARRRLG